MSYLDTAKSPCLYPVPCFFADKDKNNDDCFFCKKRIQHDKDCVPEWNCLFARFSQGGEVEPVKKRRWRSDGKENKELSKKIVSYAKDWCSYETLSFEQILDTSSRKRNRTIAVYRTRLIKSIYGHFVCSGADIARALKFPRGSVSRWLKQYDEV